jgi:site-specific DNA recombinase
VGGPLPLGYELKDGRLVVVEEEAERVRLIFRSYLELSGINELARDLRARNIRTKARTLSTTGKLRGGIAFGRGALSHLLRNRFFIGEVEYRGEVLPGEQPAIIDKGLFEVVEQKLSAHRSRKTLTRQKSDHLLRDLLFDDAGHHMIATHATKGGVRYRYYVSQPSLHGEARTARLGSISRVAAPEIEEAVTSALQKYIAEQNSGAFNGDAPIKLDHDVLAGLVSRIEVHRTQLVLALKPTDRSAESATLSIPWQKPPLKRFREILMPHGVLGEDIRPQRAERRLRLIKAIARGRRWLDEIIAGSITAPAQLATREGCTERQVNLTLSLAFLAPALVKAAVEGRLPRGVNIERLRDPDPNWAMQFRDLGLGPE